MVHRALKSTKKVPQIFELGPADFILALIFIHKTKVFVSLNWTFFCKIHNWFHDFFFTFWGSLRALCETSTTSQRRNIIHIHTWEIERVCIPRSLGPPEAIVEQVELCLDGPAMAGKVAPIEDRFCY